MQRQGTTYEAEWDSPPPSLSLSTGLHCIAFFTHNIKLCIAFCRGNNKHCIEFSSADNKPCITPPHPPEEQEMRKTAKASLVASPIFHPKLILRLERELKTKNKEKKNKSQNDRVKLNVLLLRRALSLQKGHLYNAEIESES